MKIVIFRIIGFLQRRMSRHVIILIEKKEKREKEM